MILIDYTYKTNRYSLPLFNIIGFTTIGLTFYISFTFIKDKKEDTYKVILSYLTKIYNSLNLEAPRTILIDKEDTLINVIKLIFPKIKSIVYI